MSSVGLRGTNAAQDTRFKDKEAASIKAIKFPKIFAEKVDLRKVNISVLRPWIAKKVTDIIRFEDDIVVEFAFSMLEETETPFPDPKKMQVNLLGFMDKYGAAHFMEELWKLLLSAQETVGGVPAEFIAAKKAELEKRGGRPGAEDLFDQPITTRDPHALPSRPQDDRSSYRDGPPRGDRDNNNRGDRGQGRDMGWRPPRMDQRDRERDSGYGDRGGRGGYGGGRGYERERDNGYGNRRQSPIRDARDGRDGREGRDGRDGRGMRDRDDFGRDNRPSGREREQEYSSYGRRRPTPPRRPSPTRGPDYRDDRRRSPSPPRRRERERERERERSRSRTPPRRRRDSSTPPRRRDDDTPPRRKRDDSTPPRRKRDDSTPPRPKRQDSTPPRRKRDDSTPPRRKRDDSTPPPAALAREREGERSRRESTPPRRRSRSPTDSRSPPAKRQRQSPSPSPIPHVEGQSATRAEQHEEVEKRQQPEVQEKEEEERKEQAKQEREEEMARLKEKAKASRKKLGGALGKSKWAQDDD